MKKNLFTTLLVISAICFFGQVNLNSSLTTCYALNGNATDAINSLNGTVHGAVSVTDRNNNANAAYYFSRSASDYIEIPDNVLI